MRSIIAALAALLTCAAFAATNSPALRVEQYLSTQGDGTGVTDQSVAGVDITDATNAEPIVITAAAHGLNNGDHVWIEGVLGNTAANGLWEIAAKTTDTFQLVGSAGNDDYENTADAGEGEGEPADPSGIVFPAFVYAPGATQTVELTRLVIQASDGAYSPIKYMDVAALSEPCYLRAYAASDSVQLAQAAAFLDWAALGDVVAPSTVIATAATATATIDLTRNGAPLRLDGSRGQRLVLIVRDDLSGLTSQTAHVSGLIASGQPPPFN